MLNAIGVARLGGGGGGNSGGVGVSGSFGKTKTVRWWWSRCGCKGSSACGQTAKHRSSWRAALSTLGSAALLHERRAASNVSVSNREVGGPHETRHSCAALEAGPAHPPFCFGQVADPTEEAWQEEEKTRNRNSKRTRNHEQEHEKEEAGESGDEHRNCKRKKRKRRRITRRKRKRGHIRLRGTKHRQKTRRGREEEQSEHEREHEYQIKE